MLELFNPKTEEKILEFWKREQIFEKSLTLRQAQSKKNRAKAKQFIFYEGPPFPNAKAHIGNVLTRCYKDIICRYKNMVGFNTIGRRAGWDVHGLPVELQLEKQLGLKGKFDIEKYGIDKFNEAAREMVWGFKKDWDELTERMGFWIDIEDAYITSEPHYIESLWYIISQIAKKNLLYLDFKVVPYCFRCGTSLSSFEVAQGYEKITENSVYIKFKLKNSANTFILSWTTTPWTLPGNVALAIGRDIKYDFVKVKEETLILAQNLRKNILGEVPGEVLKTVSGKDLVGLSYEPLFSVPQLSAQGGSASGGKSKASYKIYTADFVNTDEGTGVVHIAPMYGEDDFNLGAKVGLPKFHTVNLEGKFIENFGAELKNLSVKSTETENIIFAYLKETSAFLKTEKHEHDYPFCWRCKNPLL